MRFSNIAIDWMAMLQHMALNGIDDAYQVLDHCHDSEFYEARDCYVVTIECSSGTYNRVIQRDFAYAIRCALMEQLDGKQITLYVIDLDRAFFYDEL